MTSSASNQLMNLPHDGLFDGFRERSRLAVVEHGAAAFIAAFLQDADRGDVKRNVITVAGHPRSLRIQLFLESKSIVDHDFPCHRNQREVSSKLPDLYRIRIVHGNPAPPVQD